MKALSQQSAVSSAVSTTSPEFGLWCKRFAILGLFAFSAAGHSAGKLGFSPDHTGSITSRSSAAQKQSEPIPSACGGYYNQLTDVLERYARVFSPKCRQTVDRSRLQPPLSPLSWRCCTTGAGPVCAGRDVASATGLEFGQQCGGGTQEVLYDQIKAKFTRIRVYNRDYQLVYRRQWELEPNDPTYLTPNGIKLLTTDNRVRTLRFAIPGDESTVIESLTGVERVADKSGRRINQDNGRIEFGPDGSQTIKCGSFPSYTNPIAVTTKLCKALGSTL